MSAHMNLKRTVLSAVAAVLMSTLAVGSAVAPAHVNAAPTKFITHA